VFGLGFSGIIPAYVLAVRELFPASEASWRGSIGVAAATSDVSSSTGSG
jgi:hypothetical protein